MDEASAAACFTADRYQLLAFTDREGAPEHYYHFVLGFLAPVLLRPEHGDARESAGKISLAPSCGIMDGKFAELGVHDVQLIPRQTWRALQLRRRLATHTLASLDGWKTFDAARFTSLRQAMFARLGMVDVAPGAGMLVVNRGESPEFYQSDAAASKTSANLRRSVPNMADIAARLAAAGGRVNLMELETASLRQQVALFAAAPLVVAQHGAALVNMLWMQPGGRIVEILPPVGPANLFRRLAKACGHRYVAVPQETPHAAVDPRAVAAAVEKLM